MARWDPTAYETVDSRIKRFYGDHPDARILTDMVQADGEPGRTRWIVKASIWRNTNAMNSLPDSTGYAFEVDGTGMANQTAALENCETSAIGRALANLGYSGDKRASREEMEKANRQAPVPAQVPQTPPENWRALLDACKSVEAMQVLFETQARRWFTDEVRAAFTARKSALAGAEA